MNIRVLTIETTDTGSLKKFYGETLGISIIEEDVDSFTIGLQQTEIEFHQYKGSGNPVYHFAINIPSNKLTEARQWLLQKQVSLLWLEDYNSDIADFKNWNAQSVYFYDPAGNIVELIARFDLPNATDEPFSAGQLISVSEIGLVFPAEQLNEKTERLLSAFHLSYFSKQPPLEHFKAVGDDEGLFIIVPENRPWYPTKDRLATTSPVKIYFSDGLSDNWLEYDRDLQSWCNSELRFT